MRSFLSRFAALVLLAPSLSAQVAPVDSLVIQLGGMTAVTGYEQPLAAWLHARLPQSRIDRAGDVIVESGSGQPRRLIACPMDEVGYVVGGIRDDGYLTLRRVGGAPSALFDQQLEGQRVTVFGRNREVPGVVAVRSIHLTRGRTDVSDTPFSVDDAFIDVGAANRLDATRLGLGVLAPVSLTKRPQLYGTGLVAAPVAGRRAACAAVLHLAASAPTAAGSLVIAFVVEQNLTQRGILTVANTMGPFSDGLLVDASERPDFGPTSAPKAPPALRNIQLLNLPVRNRGTPVETVSLSDVARLEEAMRGWVSGQTDGRTVGP